MSDLSPIPCISCEDFSLLLDKGEVRILDIREPDELAISSLPKSINIPMMDLENKVDDLKDELESSVFPTVVICRSGARSEMVTEFLLDLGFSNIYNLSEGINGLSKIRAGLASY